MIYGICGEPGAFKTAYVVQEVLVKELRNKRDIYTNIDGLKAEMLALHFDLEFLEVDRLIHRLGVVYDINGNETVTKDSIRDFYKTLPNNCTVILDETQLYFNSRDFKELKSKELNDWMSQHRHYGQDFIWITPDVGECDINIRRNTHLCFKLVRAEHLGMKKSSSMMIFRGCDFEKRPLKRSFFSPKDCVFECYSSYFEDNVKEKRQSYNVFLRSPMMWFIFIAFGWAAYVLLSGKFERVVFHKNEKKEEIVIEQKTEEKTEEKEIEKNENLCIVNTSNIQGNRVYKLSDGSITYSSDYLPCDNIERYRNIKQKK